MPLRPKNPDTPPRGMQWKYLNHEDNFLIEHIHLEVLRKMAKEHRIRNNYPLGSNFSNDFLDNVCANATDIDCVSTEPPTLAQRLNKFATAMKQWASAGFPLATPEEVDRRLTICEACVHYSGSVSIFKVGCALCGCSSKKANVLTETCPANKW